MKTIFNFLLFLFLHNLSYSQTIDHILFDYDAAGNQIKRYTIDLNAGRASNEVVKDISELSENELIKADIYEDISYYPNPVKEELYIKWVNVNSVYVSSIFIYSLSGQLVNNYSGLKDTTSMIVPFGTLPPGIYTIFLEYSNGETKTLKIVKN